MKRACGQISNDGSYDRTTSMLKNVAEIAALRRDAHVFGQVVLSVPHIARLSTHVLVAGRVSNEYHYWSRLFDTVEYTCGPCTSVVGKRCGMIATFHCPGERMVRWLRHETALMTPNCKPQVVYYCDNPEHPGHDEYSTGVLVEDWLELAEIFANQTHAP